MRANMTWLIHRQNGWKGGDQNMRGKNPALSGARRGKSTSRARDNSGWVTSTVAQEFGFQSVQTNSSKMSGLSQTSLLECVTSQLRYLA